MSVLCLWLEAACSTESAPRVVPDGLRPSYATKPWVEPILLVHGFGASADTWGDLDEVLAADGHLVTTPTLSAFASVDERARELGDQIDLALAEATDRGYFAPRLHIIAHSMGGLDARYAISSLGYADRVATLVTVGTPHRGSPVADVVLGAGDRLSSFGLTRRSAESLAEYLGLPDITNESTRRALRDLTVEQALRFNASNPDAPEVVYESWAGLSNPFARRRPSDAVNCNVAGNSLPNYRHELPGNLIATALIAGDWFKSSPNDGVVPVSSARWSGFNGCILSDHIALTKTASTTFNPNGFYRDVAARLTSDSVASHS